MKKRLSVFLLICSMLVSSIIGIDGVWADEQVSGTVTNAGTGHTSGCSGGNCYSLGTAGVRIALLTEEGKKVDKTNVVDLWFFKEHEAYQDGKLTNLTGLMTYNGTNVYYNQKNMRQDLPNYGSNISNLITIGGTVDLISIDSVFPGILDGMNNVHKDDCDDLSQEDKNAVGCSDNEKYMLSDNYLNTRVPNSVGHILSKIVSNAQKDSSYLDLLYEKIGIERSKVSNKYYLQLEPLVQWANHGLDGSYYDANKYNSYNFYGTPSELTMIFYSVQHGNLGIFCVNNSIKTGGICSNGSWSAFNRINGYANTSESTNYYNFASVGVYTHTNDAEIPGNIFTKVDVSKNDVLNAEGYSKIISDSDHSEAYGVGFISLAIISTCDDMVEDAFTMFENDNNSLIAKINEINGQVTEDINFLLFYNNFLITKDNVSCTKPSCDVVAQRYISKFNTNRTTAINTFYNDVFQKSSNLSSENHVAPDEYATEETTYNFFAYRDGLTDSTEDLCGLVSCPTLLSRVKETPGTDAYYKKLNTINALFGNQYTKLTKAVIEGVGVDADCDYTPNCPPSDTTKVACEDNGSGNSTFTLSDNTDWDSCTLEGYAYNGNEGKDNNQGSKDENGYCQEKVQFTFPVTNEGGYDVIGGNTFKWGIDESKENSLFGKMKVTRICQITDRENVDLDWARERINPEITINYKQAIPKDAKVEKVWRVSENLNFELSKYYVTENGANKNIEFNSNGDTLYECSDGDCEGQRIVMTAEYELNYGDKLKWYTTRENPNENVSRDSIDIEDDALATHSNYYFIGYGLPTSFLTPTNLKIYNTGYGKITFGFTETTDKDGNGYLYATIKNIGTKNTRGDTSKYHFDEYVKFNLESDSGVDTEQSKVYYSCSYGVNNRLFDYESGSGGPGDPETPKGLDVVFRTVELVSSTDELDEAFPGRTGNGVAGADEEPARGLGENWDKLSDDLIAKILSVNVYNQESPMYQITLDVPMIKKIRNLNAEARAAGIDPYTDMTVVDGSTTNAGLTGYFYKDGTVRSRFLTKLFYQERTTGKFKSICIYPSNSDETGRYNRTPLCNQSWWEQDNKNQLIIE